jgi:hypothetical protein
MPGSEQEAHHQKDVQAADLRRVTARQNDGAWSPTLSAAPTEYNKNVAAEANWRTVWHQSYLIMDLM